MVSGFSILSFTSMASDFLDYKFFLGGLLVDGMDEIQHRTTLKQWSKPLFGNYSGITLHRFLGGAKWVSFIHSPLVGGRVV